SCVKLFLTGSTRGHEDSRPAVKFGSAYLRKQVLTHRHAEFVKIFFVSKAAGHATAFDAGRNHVKSRCTEKVFGWNGCADRFLLAMAMVEELRPQWMAGCRKEIRDA